MSNVPDELKYTRTHEWVRVDDDGTVVIGITDHAQELLGDMVYVELPDAGRSVAKEEDCAVVESVKAASDVYSPLTGEVAALNGDLEDSPDLVNRDPYGDGWLFRLRLSDAAELDELLSAEDYARMLEEEED